jgi:hypothetical protein
VVGVLKRNDAGVVTLSSCDTIARNTGTPQLTSMTTLPSWLPFTRSFCTRVRVSMP